MVAVVMVVVVVVVVVSLCVYVCVWLIHRGHGLFPHVYIHTHLQYRELEQSLTKQATDWVAQKKKEGKVDKSLRWSQVSGALNSLFPSCAL